MTTVLDRPPAALRARVDERAWSKRLRLSVPSVVVAGGTAWLVWVGVTTLERSGSLGATLAAGRAEIAAPLLLVMVSAVLVCERVWPAQRRRALARGHVHDACWFALHLVAVVPLVTLLGVAFGHLLGGLDRWIGPSWTASWPRWSLFALTLVLMDGCNWLAHWADHRFAVLWRMHAVHHTQEELSVLTSFRAHPLAHWAGFLLATVPVIVVLGSRPLAPVLVTLYICLSTLSHANVSWSFGPLGKVLVSPAYHRLHDSLDEPAGVNLGIVLTIWDSLARRARFPDRDAPACPTGLPGRPLSTEQCATVRHVPLLLGQLVEPFTLEPGGGPHSRTKSPRSSTPRQVPSRAAPSSEPGGPRRRCHSRRPPRTSDANPL